MRAVIFDKGNSLKWKPSRPEDDTEAFVDSLLATLPPKREPAPLPECAA